LPRDSDLPDGCADLVILEAVIEHIADPVTALMEAKRLLAPKGRLVLTTPNMASGDFRFLRGRWTGMLAPHAHLFLFDPGSMARLLRQSGLEPVEVGSHSVSFCLSSVNGWKQWLYLKSCLWRAHQDLGALYGRCLGKGPILYAVAACG
jgi:SAM-dependent methyltransferase